MAGAAHTETYLVFRKKLIESRKAAALSQAELAQIVSNITGKPLNYVPVELEALIQGMVDGGLPRPVAETYASIDEATAKGQFENVSGDFEELTGEKPTSVSELLKAHKDEL